MKWSHAYGARWTGQVPHHSYVTSRGFQVWGHKGGVIWGQEDTGVPASLTTLTTDGAGPDTELRVPMAVGGGAVPLLREFTAPRTPIPGRGTSSSGRGILSLLSPVRTHFVHQFLTSPSYRHSWTGSRLLSEDRPGHQGSIIFCLKFI